MASKASRSEVIDKAARLVRGGALGPALKEYERLFAQDPSDWTVANTLGDLYLRMGRTDEGISHFMRLAEQVAGDGYIAKSRALYRKILRVQPTNDAAAARVVELESQHLDSSSFVQRMLGTVRQSQAAAQQAAAAPESRDETLPEPRDETPLESRDEAAPARVSRPEELAGHAETPQTSGATPVAPAAAARAAPVVPQSQPIAAPAPPSAVPVDGPDARLEDEEAVEPAAAVDVATPAVPRTRAVSLVSLSPPAAASAGEAEPESSDEWTSIDLDIKKEPVGDIGAALGLRLARPSPAAESPRTSEAAFEEFELPPDDWIPAGLRLAALPLSDDPAADKRGDEDPDVAAAYRLLQASTAHSAASGDLHGAAAAVERFLRDHPRHVSALDALIDLGVDGRLESLASAQIRLANACLETGRRARARNVAVDLLCRYPGDRRVLEVIGRVDAQAATADVTRAPAPVRPEVNPAVEELELFDDDGLVTGGTSRDRARSEPASTTADLDELLDAVDAATTASEAIARANRLKAAGDTRGAISLLETSMKTPSLRPIVGVRLSELYRVGGDCLNALRCLELAAEQPPLDKACGHALAYELALTLETMGHDQDALGVYRELLSEVGPAFRDVAARANQLSAA